MCRRRGPDLDFASCALLIHAKSSLAVLVSGELWHWWRRHDRELCTLTVCTLWCSFAQLPHNTELLDAQTAKDVELKRSTGALGERLAHLIRYEVDAAMCSSPSQPARSAATYKDVKPRGWSLLFDRYW